MRQQAAAGDIILLFADESVASTHPYLSHMWARRGADLRIEAPGKAKKRAIFGFRDSATGQLDVITSDTKLSTDFIHLLDQIDAHHGLGEDYNGPPVVLVLDNASIHTSKLSRQALADRPWLRVEWLPKYASELNDIERDWRTLKRLHLANQSIFDVLELDRIILNSIAAMNTQRDPTSCADFGVAA